MARAGKQGQNPSRMRAQGEASRGSPCAILWKEKEGRHCPPIGRRVIGLCSFWGLLAGGLSCLLCLLFRGELLLHLGCNGVTVNLVSSGGIA